MTAAGDIQTTKAAAAPVDVAGMASRLEALTKSQQDLSVELNKDNALLKSQNNPELAKALELQLTKNGFPSFALSANGDIVYNPVSPSSDQNPTASSGSSNGPSESDFVNFAKIVASKFQPGDPALTTGVSVDAKDFTADFGAADAAVLNRLGLNSISLKQNQVVATFAKPGEVSFGDDPLMYSSQVTMDYANANGTMNFSKISGLKGSDSGFTANVTAIDIAPPDPKTGLTDVKYQGKIGFISKT